MHRERLINLILLLLDLHYVNITGGYLLSERHHGGVTAHICQVSTAVAVRDLDQVVEIDVFTKLDTFQVDCEELSAAFFCR